MHDETTIEGTRWRGVRELEKSRDAAYETLQQAQDSYDRAEELAARAEKAIREKNREEVGEWAASIFEDERAVILSLATTGLEDPIDIVEVEVLDVAGETVFSERVRPATFEGGGPIPIDPGATDMHGYIAEDLEDAPTLAEVWPQFREALEDRRVVIYNAEYAGRVLAQTLDRYGLKPPEEGVVGCAMQAYARIAGHWSLEDEVYRPVALPGQDGTPEGNARALHALLRDIAGLVPVPVSSGGNDEITEEDFDSIPF